MTEVNDDSPESQELPVHSGKKSYEIDGTNIEVAWKQFQPNTTSPESQPVNPHNAVIFLPGIFFTEQAKATASMSQELANHSHMTTYAIDTYTEAGSPHSLSKEAKAAQRFIDEVGIEDKTLVGQSQGGDAAMHIAASSPNVKGLILIDSMGLYDQPLGKFIANYVRENIISSIRTEYPPHADKAKLKARNKQYNADATVEILRQIKLAGGIHRYPKRLLSEIREILTVNPYAQEITAPIVIVHGKKDNLSQPKRIIPHQTEQGTIIEDIHEREQFLQKNLFPNSPYVRMVVAEKMGYHGLAAFRPESIARGSLYILDRFHSPRQSHPQAA